MELIDKYGPEIDGDLIQARDILRGHMGLGDVGGVSKSLEATEGLEPEIELMSKVMASDKEELPETRKVVA